MAAYSKMAGSLQMLHEIPTEVNSGQHSQKCGDCLCPALDHFTHPTVFSILSSLTLDFCDELMLNALRCQLTYQGQVVTNAEARFNKSLRPRKPEGSLGRTAQDVHLDSHTAPEL